MSTVHFRQQAGAAATSAIAGDVTGTLLASIVSKVAGVTPGAGGLALLDDASIAAALVSLGLGAPSANGVSLLTAADYATMRTLLGVSASSSEWTEVVSTAQQSDTIGAPVTFTGIASQPLTAASVYAFDAWVLGGTAINTTGLQWNVAGPTNSVIESETAITPLTSSTQAIRQGQVNNVVAGTSFVSGALGMGRAFGIIQTHATAPDAGLTIKFNTEVAASAATVYVVILRYRKMA